MNTSNYKIVAIHQPNFFPWLGYFDKIARSDVFILLDNVQFPKTGRGTWVNRVKLSINGSAAWVTLPVTRKCSGTRLISEMMINNEKDWRGKLIKTLQANYGKAPFYREIMPAIEVTIINPVGSLAEFNIVAIRSLSNLLGIDTKKLILGSSLQTEGSSTELLISMTQAVSGTAYLCGGGADGYQEDGKFAAAGIELVYQNFKHPVYPQHRSPEFISGLSILDALMNCGVHITKKLLEQVYDRA